MRELGFYDFRADYSVNIQTYKEETVTTVFHEMTHMLITLQSGYGTFLNLLKISKVIDEHNNFIFDFFFMHMIKMQEACSTFSELIFTLINRDSNAVYDKISSMKLLNKKYYKYVSPLLFVLNYTDHEINRTNTFSIPVREIYNLIKEMAIKSCDVDLTQIPFDFFKRKNYLEKIANSEKFVTAYLPNKRFKIAVKELKNQLNLFSQHSYSHEKMTLILKNVYSVAFKCDFVPNFSMTNDFKIRLENHIKKYKAFVLKLYESSEDYDIIRDRISAISVKETSIDRLTAYSLPYTTNKQYEMKPQLFTANELNSKAPSIFFVMGDNKTIYSMSKSPRFDEIKTSNKISSLVSLYRTGIFKLRSGILLILAFDYKNKCIYTAIINKNDLIRLDSNVPMVVNYKYYPHFRKHCAALNQDFFVYCDRTYENAIPIINELYPNYFLTGNLLSYTCNEKDISMSVLVIKIKDHHYFFLPIVRSVENLIMLDIIQGKLNVDLSLDLDQKIIDVIDAILNNLYFF